MNYWQGKKVRLRGVEPTDAETFFQWNLDSGMGRALDFVWPPISQALVAKQVQEMALRTLEADNFTWVIEDGSGRAVGSVATHDCNRRNGTFGYGISVAAEHQRRGYATEAICHILKYYFEELRYQKATIQVFGYNEISASLHEKLGFVKEGVLRQMIYTGGQYWDLLYYGMVRAEWEKSPYKL